MFRESKCDSESIEWRAANEEVDPTADPFENVSSILAARSLRRNVAKLPLRMRKIVIWHSGIGGNEVLTLDEIGERLGCSRERVCIDFHRALCELREMYRREAA